MPPHARSLLRGPMTAKLLARLGIDAPRYWTLVDLFGELTERRELYSQIGATGSGLKFAGLLYLALSGLMSLFVLLASPPAMACLLFFLVFNAFLLLVTILPEAGNTLVNPVEALVVAHLPVDGATYTAAKLTHLLRILLYFIPALNLIPSLAGLAAEDSFPAYPFVHLASASILGLVVALACCALYGWLTLLVSPGRLKAAGQWLELSPWFALIALQFNRAWLKSAPLGWNTVSPHLRWTLLAGGAAAALVLMWIGLRALSADYLVKVACIAQGGVRTRTKQRRRSSASLVCGWLGGPPALGGFDYASIMTRRDGQFRRQAFMILAPLAINAAAVFKGINENPFDGRFSPIHIYPHVLGIASLVLSAVITGGSHPRAAWIFLLFPLRSLAPFSRGMALAFAVALTGVPNLVLFALLAWAWGFADALLFALFSTAVGLAYLSISLSLIEGMPFARQVDPEQHRTLLPVMLGAGLIAAVVVALQHFILFESRSLVLGFAVLAAAGAAAGSRYSLGAFEEAIRFHLANLSQEGSSLYREVN